MPEVPQHADAILQAAYEHAGRVRASLAALSDDLSRAGTRRASLGEAAREEGLDLLAAAASAMAGLCADLNSDGRTRTPDEY
jgi:hypothetical protein